MPLRTALPGKNASMHELRSTRIDARAISQGELLQVWKLTRTAGNSLPFLRVCGLTKHYVRRSGILRGRVPAAAVQDVDFEIPPGKTLALVGSSGSGKSTVARCVTRLEKPDAGQIWMGGTDISWLGNRDLRPYRSEIQMIFQDAVTSMNPRLSAAQ